MQEVEEISAKFSSVQLNEEEFQETEPEFDYGTVNAPQYFDFSRLEQDVSAHSSYFGYLFVGL